MRLIDRLQAYLTHRQISAYAFEHSCRLANGYLGKQLKGKGAVGSDILLRIKEAYADLSLVWLVTGRGHMLLELPRGSQHIVVPAAVELSAEQKLFFTSYGEMIGLLQKQVEKCERMMADKDRIIALQEEQLQSAKRVVYKRVS